ncbi:MAG: hypothetical protein LBC89_05420, partial [Bacteroidales bacterium]|nr:hypothetical protein [Bacteroidales bacterium]
MKKLILFLTILMVLSPLALSLRAAEVTWSASTYMTAQNITANGTAADGTSINVNDYIIFSINKNDMSGSSVPVWYPNDPSLRFYRPTGSSTIVNSLDFALTGITVTAITMVCQNTDKPEMELKVDGSVYATTAVGADKSVSFSGFSALSSLSLRATSAGGKNGRLSTITVTYTINSSNTVATPSITPLSGNYAVPFTALITCEDDHHSYPPHAVFWYTTDNFVSTPNDTAHPISVEISGTTTLKAWAVEGNVSTGLNYSDTVTRVYTFPTSLANVAAFNAADVDDFVSIAGLSVIRHSVNNLWATDGTNAIHAYGLSTARAVLNDGDVISLAGDRANYNGFPEMTNPVLLTSISGTPVTPVDDFDILSATTADFGKFVTVKNVKFASASALENGVAVTNQLMDLSTIDSQKNYDITGVINYNNSTLQFLPTAVAEVQP